MDGPKVSLILLLLLGTVVPLPPTKRIKELISLNESSMNLPFNDMCRHKDSFSKAAQTRLDIKIFDPAYQSRITNSGNFLGEGSFGKVFKTVYDGKFAAVKMVKMGIINKMDAMREAFAWMKLAVQFEEDAIPLYECAYDSSYIYLVQGLMDSDVGEFSKDFKDTAKVTDFDRYYIFYRMAKEIENLHAVELVHFDLKPQNFMISAKSTYSEKLERSVKYDVRVIDFGMTDKPNIVGKIIGTPPFIAPEMWNQQGTSKSCDVFSLGATFWNMLQPVIFFNNRCFKSYGYDSSCKEKLIRSLDSDFPASKQASKFTSNYPKVGEMIKDMMNPNPGVRPKMAEVSEFFFKLAKEEGKGQEIIPAAEKAKIKKLEEAAKETKNENANNLRVIKGGPAKNPFEVVNNNKKAAAEHEHVPLADKKPQGINADINAIVRGYKDPNDAKVKEVPAGEPKVAKKRNFNFGKYYV